MFSLDGPRLRSGHVTATPGDTQAWATKPPANPTLRATNYQLEGGWPDCCILV